MGLCWGQLDPNTLEKKTTNRVISERYATIFITVCMCAILWLLIVFTYNIVVTNNICCPTYNTSLTPSIKFGDVIDFYRVNPFWNISDPFASRNQPEAPDIATCSSIESRHTTGFLCVFAGLNLTITNRNFIPESDIPIENVTEINLGGVQGSRIEILTSDVCTKFPNLIFYYAYSLEMTGIEEIAFNNCTVLETLYLDNNNLTSLSPDLFMRNPNLVWLDLSNNRLVSLPLGIFRKNILLSGLELDGNFLIDFPVRKMRTLRLLRRLWLHDNRIQAFDLREAVRKFPALSELFLCNNQGSTREDMTGSREFLNQQNIITDYENCV